MTNIQDTSGMAYCFIQTICRVINSSNFKMKLSNCCLSINCQVRYMTIFTCLYKSVTCLLSSYKCSEETPCSQISNNLGCSCVPGFELGEDEKSCGVRDPSWKTLLAFERGGIGYVNGNKSVTKLTSLVATQPINTCLACDARNQIVYWLDNFVIVLRE